MGKWIIWVLFLMVSFGVLEYESFANNTDTLSRTVWTFSAAFPPFGYICGFIAGFLACHFWWGGAVSFAPLSKIKPGG